MKSITGHTTRTRDQARLIAPRPRSLPRARAPIRSMDPISDDWVVRRGGGGDTLFVDQVRLPDEVNAGGIVDVTVEVVNAALTIPDSDDDKCGVGGIAGFEYEVEVNPSWGAAETETTCLSISENREVHSFSLDAPDEGGNESIEITVTGTGTGYSGGGEESILIVDDGSDDGSDGGDRPDPDPIDDDPNGGGGDGGFSFDDLFGTQTTISLVSLTLLVVLALLITR